MSKRGKSPQRADPYAASTSVAKRVFQFALFSVVVAVLVVAGIVLYGQWLAGRYGGQVRIDAGNTALNPAEYLYLQTYLATRAEALEAPAGSAAFATTFIVNPGESAATIAANLAAQGLLRDQELFLNYARYYGLDAGLEAGTYRVDPALSVPELVTLLTRSVGQEVTLRFLEGWRLEEMAAYLAATRPAQIDPDVFLAIAQRRAAFDWSPYPFLAGLPREATVEGYLFPDTYRLALDSDAVDLVDVMLANFDRQVTPALRQAFGASGLTLHEAVTLASIVERESVVDDERAIIARVFINRLNQDIQLAADPTIQYALGRQLDGSWWKTGLTQADLALDSPYNTYLVKGLPPGPIANPGLASLQAVAAPAAVDYLYFVASCNPETPGRHQFSVTYEEHLANVALCR